MVVAMRTASVDTTGIELSAIGLGGFELGESPSDVPAARAAIAAAMASPDRILPPMAFVTVTVRVRRQTPAHPAAR
jgi:hypothetical protein